MYDSFIPLDAKGDLAGFFPTADIAGLSFASVSTSLWNIAISCALVIGLGVGAWGLGQWGVASDSGSRLREGLEKMGRSIKGVIGVLLIPVIAYIIDSNLLRADIVAPVLSRVPQVIQIAVTPTTSSISGTTGTPSSASEASIRSTLAGSGITVNKAACASGQMSNCTNVEGWPDETIRFILKLKSLCPTCEMTVTGGTEPGHQTHGPGKRPFDLRKATNFDNFIKSVGSVWTPSARCYAQYRYDGWTFCDEIASDPHWHVY